MRKDAGAPGTEEGEDELKQLFLAPATEDHSLPYATVLDAMKVPSMSLHLSTVCISLLSLRLQYGAGTLRFWV